MCKYSSIDGIIIDVGGINVLNGYSRIRSSSFPRGMQRPIDFSKTRVNLARYFVSRVIKLPFIYRDETTRF